MLFPTKTFIIYTLFPLNPGFVCEHCVPFCSKLDFLNHLKVAFIRRSFSHYILIVHLVVLGEVLMLDVQSSAPMRFLWIYVTLLIYENKALGYTDG